MEITAESSILMILLAGFMIGLLHALDPDHLAAVSAIVSDRKNLISSAFVGGLWGVGHTLSLLIVGLLVIFLKFQISETVEGYLEAAVGVMLIILGLNVLRKLLVSNSHIHEHEHDGEVHTHEHSHSEAGDENHHSLAPRSVIVGMIHGLAGSAGLMLLIASSISSPFSAVLYILLFGIGSIGGMIIMSFLMGLPLYLTYDRFAIVNKILRLAAGVFSLVVGVLLIHEKLFA